MPKRDPNRDAVQKRLEALGFAVDPIDEHGSERRPDLLAHADEQMLYVEVKTRTEDSAFRAKMESIPVGTTAEVLTNLDKHNSISAGIEHAQSQLSTLAGPDDFRLLWFRVDSGPFVHGALEQVGATLYGIRMVTVGEPGAEQPRACVYAGRADFRRFREIDGTMVEIDQMITLLLNPFSPRRRVFTHSRIAKVVGLSVFDVGKASQARVVFVAGADAPRDNDEELLEHLRKQYPGETFHSFAKANAGTVVTTIDGRGSRDV